MLKPFPAQAGQSVCSINNPPMRVIDEGLRAGVKDLNNSYLEVQNAGKKWRNGGEEQTVHERDLKGKSVT